MDTTANRDRLIAACATDANAAAAVQREQLRTHLANGCRTSSRVVAMIPVD